MPTDSTTISKGDALELRIRDFFQSEIDADRFWAKKSCCKVFWKKGYFSKDRESSIIFDVSIEVFLPGQSEYSMLVLIECKNYAHSVPVDDAEEFFTKVQQVGAANAKAVIASTASFQRGARTFSKSKGIGLMRYFDADKVKWELKRSPSASARSTSVDDSHYVDAGLTQDDFRSPVFDWYLQSPMRDTNSLWDFFEDIALDSSLSPSQVRRVTNSRSKLKNQVEFQEKDELEGFGLNVLLEMGYVGGAVDLPRLCELEFKRTGLVVELDVTPPNRDDPTSVLGRITFDPGTIQIYKQETPNLGRERFTLAHELAHHLLSHGEYLNRESCDGTDFVLERSAAVSGSDVARMEFQANYLAASLLMPRAHFVADFREVIRELNIPDKGFGALYVDSQPCNLQNYNSVTGRLMQRYSVSRTAAHIRLESVGLLQDVRHLSGLRPVQDIFPFRQ